MTTITREHLALAALAAGAWHRLRLRLAHVRLDSLCRDERNAEEQLRALAADLSVFRARGYLLPRMDAHMERLEARRAELAAERQRVTSAIRRIELAALPRKEKTE